VYSLSGVLVFLIGRESAMQGSPEHRIKTRIQLCKWTSDFFAFSLPTFELQYLFGKGEHNVVLFLDLNNSNNLLQWKLLVYRRQTMNRE
jgi:hypothetical protein